MGCYLQEMNIGSYNLLNEFVKTNDSAKDVETDTARVGWNNYILCFWN